MCEKLGTQTTYTFPTVKDELAATQYPVEICQQTQDWLYIVGSSVRPMVHHGGTRGSNIWLMIDRLVRVAHTHCVARGSALAILGDTSTIVLLNLSVYVCARDVDVWQWVLQHICMLTLACASWDLNLNVERCGTGASWADIKKLRELDTGASWDLKVCDREGEYYEILWIVFVNIIGPQPSPPYQSVLA
jgi:hypothetical protein